MSLSPRYNQNLFDEFRKLNLPLGEYIIAASGVLAIRGIREAKDIDVVVSERLWNQLKKPHQIKIENDAEKIVLTENIEAFWKGSFDKLNRGKKRRPSVNDQISRAEIIDGLSFQSLADCLWFKAHSNREKDKIDIELIKKYLITHPGENTKIEYKLK